MPKVRALAPLEGEEGPIAVDEIVDVSDEQAATWKAQGKISLIADEEASANAAGVYDEVTGRDEVKPLDPEEVAPEAHSSKKGSKK